MYIYSCVLLYIYVLSRLVNVQRSAIKAGTPDEPMGTTGWRINQLVLSILYETWPGRRNPGISLRPGIEGVRGRRPRTTTARIIMNPPPKFPL